MDETRIRDLLIRHWKHAASDQLIAHEIYHHDAILEFPQSGERFLGKEKFQAFRERYPADVDFKMRRITGTGHVWIAENLISYDGGPWMFTVNILQFRGEKVASEYIYVMNGFEAPEWRAGYREDFEPTDVLDPVLGDRNAGVDAP